MPVSNFLNKEQKKGLQKAFKEDEWSARQLTILSKLGCSRRRTDGGYDN
jgi:hypothetical protein